MKTFNEWVNESRTIKKLTIGSVTLRLIKDYDEFQVQYIVNGVNDEQKTYYADDIEDAMDTMTFTAKRLAQGKA